MKPDSLSSKFITDFLTGKNVKPGQMLPSTRELAKHYGISLPTLGKTMALLEQDGWISKSQGRRMEIRKTATSDNLPQARNRLIACIIQDFGLGLGTQLMRGVEKTVNQRGAFFKLAYSSWNIEAERKQIENLLRTGVDGVVILPVLRHTSDQEYLATDFRDVPIVTVDLVNSEMERSSVIFDNWNAGRSMAEYCLKQNRQRIAFIGYEPTLVCRSLKDRLTGYHFALKEAGVESLEILMHADNKIRERELPEAIQHFISLKTRPDALILPTDNDAWLAIQILKSKGICVPDDVLVCGFDNLQDQYWNCHFPTTDPDFMRMGVCATEMLFDAIESKSNSLREIVLPCPVITPQVLSKRYFKEEEFATTLQS